MYRALGIPARYASGYRVTVADDSMVTDVTDQDTHAWAEVYLSGLGWIPVETTPGFGETSMLPEVENDVETPPSASPSPSPSAEPADSSEAGSTPTPAATPTPSAAADDTGSSQELGTQASDAPHYDPEIFKLGAYRLLLRLGREIASVWLKPPCLGVVMEQQG